jgi:hypothetical protein
LTASERSESERQETPKLSQSRSIVPGKNCGIGSRLVFGARRAFQPAHNTAYAYDACPECSSPLIFGWVKK